VVDRLHPLVAETLCMVYAAARRLGLEVVELIVYGSWARGDWLRCSDLDVVVVATNWPTGRRLDRPDPLYRLLSRMKPPLWPQILGLEPDELRELVEAPTHLRDASRYWVRLERRKLDRLCRLDS
jgi:predicted nucleotidyltransferase